MRAVPFIAALLATGCATAKAPIPIGQIEPFDYYYRPLGDVQDAWGPGAKQIGVRCFFRRSPNREMWVAWGHQSCIMHEICHAAGGSEEDCRQKFGP